MSKKSTANRRLSVFSLSLVLLIGSQPSLFAAESTSVYQKLNEYENVLFGQTEASSGIEKRLQKIEKQLFGKSTKGSNTASRIAEIEKVMSGKEASNYLPPIAPAMDRSEFAPTPKQAPENPLVEANQIDREEDAPLPADSSDRVRGLLRQAMQNYSQGKTAEAERLYQQVLATDFRNVDANYNLGAIAESKGDLNSAKRYYSAALKTSPGDQDINDALNSINQKLKNQTAVAKTPPPSGANNQAGAAPVTAADKAIAKEAADAYKRGNFDDAIAKLGYLARKNPYDANTQFALGQAFRGKGKTNDAIKHLRSAASLDPKNELYAKTLSEAQTQIEDQQTASTSGSSGTNDITPFQGLPGDSMASESGSGGLAAVEDYLRRNTGGGMMMGSVTSYGSPGFGMGFGGSSLGGLPMLGTAPGGTRLKRMVTSSLAGAAMGAMSNRGYPGGMKQGAMRGAMYGGLFGLMMGGF